MCLGIPGRIVERLADREGLAYCRVAFGELLREVCTACVPESQAGDYVIVHAGLAISRLDADEADRLLDHLRQMGELTEDAP